MAREIERIPRILRKLGEVWLIPGWEDMRLGQLVANIQSMGIRDGESSRRGDVASMDDDVFERTLDSILKRHAASAPIQIPWTGPRSHRDS